MAEGMKSLVKGNHDNDPRGKNSYKKKSNKKKSRKVKDQIQPGMSRRAYIKPGIN